MSLEPPTANRDRITIRAKSLAQAVVPGSSPILVPYKKVRHAKLGSCVDNVRDYIPKNGGSIVYGWAIWEIPPLYVQAEFHAIWKSPEDSFLDVSPPHHGGQLVTFIPAPSDFVFDGRNVPSHFMPYDANCLESQSYCQLIERCFQLFNPAGGDSTIEPAITPEIEANSRERKAILERLQLA